MKIAKALTVILATLAIATASQATTLNSGNPIDSSYVPQSFSVNGTGATYTYTGSLQNNTELTFTFFDTGRLLTGPLTSTGTLGAMTFTSVAAMNSTTTNGASPVFVLSSLSPNVAFGSVVFENRSGVAESFTALFSGVHFGAGSITTAVASVPLPPAMILFASGLIALAGFGAYRKNRDQA